LKAEIAGSERRGHPLIVVLVDLNDFKEINDECGHQAGDLVLRIRQALEQFDEGIGRGGALGGDEFMMLLVDCEVEQLSRVLVRPEGFEVQVNGKTLPISVAAGWKAYERRDRVEELIEAADRRLYYNKEIVKRREPAVVAKV
jgi:diguanylate cyclase (GGDEF)-like protein